VLAGVVIGIALSLVWLIYVSTSPGIPILGREPGTQVFRDLTENAGDETFPGIVVVRLDGGLFFATADAVEERIRGLTVQNGGRRAHAVVIDLEGVDLVDSQGAAKLSEILDYARSIDVELRLARLKPAVAAVLSKDGVLERFGADHLHGNVYRAVEAQRDLDRSPTQS
jgi:anti-anti-sigma factor